MNCCSCCGLYLERELTLTCNKSLPCFFPCGHKSAYCLPCQWGKLVVNHFDYNEHTLLGMMRVTCDICRQTFCLRDLSF